VGLSDGAADG
jgi:hypothetical protein